MSASIEIDNVSKHFKLNHARADSLKERVVNRGRSNRPTAFRRHSTASRRNGWSAADRARRISARLHSAK